MRTKILTTLILLQKKRKKKQKRKDKITTAIVTFNYDTTGIYLNPKLYEVAKSIENLLYSVSGI